MKKILPCLILVFMLTGTAHAFKDKPHVNVTGTGTLEVVPDEMFWILRVENNGPEIKKLAKMHSDIVSGLLAKLKSFRIQEDEIQTTRMQFGERWDHSHGKRSREGFFSSSIIRFKLTEFNQYQDLWQDLTDVKGMNIQDVAFGYSKKIKVQSKARTMALTAAQKKAEQMARALGCEIGTPLWIEALSAGHEIYRTNRVLAQDAGFGGAANTGKSYSPGKIRIESRVNAGFSLKCKAQPSGQ